MGQSLAAATGRAEGAENPARLEVRAMLSSSFEGVIAQTLYGAAER